MPSTKIYNIILHAVLPLVFGLIIYAFLRPDSVFFIKSLHFNLQSFFFDALKYHGVDALWAYSFTSVLIVLTQFPKKHVFITSTIFVTVLEGFTGYLHLQTFDWLDLLFMWLAVCGSCFMVRR